MDGGPPACLFCAVPDGCATMTNSSPLKIYDHGIGAFTAEELDTLERYCDGLVLTRGHLAGLSQGSYDDVIRITQIASIKQKPEIMWFYERLAEIVRGLNGRSYRFDLRGFSEAPQYMVYRDSEGGHFDWHMDMGPQPPRKFSLTIQLSDPSHYEGCELQFNTGTVIASAPKNRGVAIGFPSYMIHRVTPITAGTRKAIVAWVTGPDFK
jgi:PKHD-type hydroxylase